MTQHSLFETADRPDKDKRCYSVCRLSDNRYYWVVWVNYREALAAIQNEFINHLALGVTLTKEEAIAEAEEVAGEKPDILKSIQAQTYYRVVVDKKYITKWGAILYDLPRFCVCSLGKKRWFWIAWARGSRNGQSIFVVGDLDFVTHQGYASTQKEAVGQARAAVGENATRYAASTAQDYHRSVVVKNRRTPNTNTTETAQVEYVYSRSGRRCRIVKKTKERIYVLKQEGGERTFMLDRQAIESEGCAFHRATYYHWYTEEKYREIMNQRSQGPLCFEALGLKPDATEADVRKAYKALAKEMHPDRGGNEADFIKLKESYDQAMRLVKGRNGKTV